MANDNNNSSQAMNIDCPFDILTGDAIFCIFSLAEYESWFDIMLVCKKWYEYGSYALKPTEEYIERAVKACCKKYAPNTTYNRLQHIVNKYDGANIASCLKYAIESKQATDILLKAEVALITTAIMDEYVGVLLEGCNKAIKDIIAARDYRRKHKILNPNPEVLKLEKNRAEADERYRNILSNRKIKNDVAIMFAYVGPHGGESPGIEALLADVRAVNALGTDIMWYLARVCTFRKGPKGRVVATLDALFQLIPEEMLAVTNHEYFCQGISHSMFQKGEENEVLVARYPHAVFWLYKIPLSHVFNASHWCVLGALKMACEEDAVFLVEWILEQFPLPEEIEHSVAFMNAIEDITFNAPDSKGTDIVIDHYSINLKEFISVLRFGQSIMRLLKNRLVFSQLSERVVLKRLCANPYVYDGIIKSAFLNDYPDIKAMALELNPCNDDESLTNNLKKHAVDICFYF
jgi:hypothetical protein